MNINLYKKRMLLCGTALLLLLIILTVLLIYLCPVLSLEKTFIGLLVLAILCYFIFIRISYRIEDRLWQTLFMYKNAPKTWKSRIAAVLLILILILLFDQLAHFMANAITGGHETAAALEVSRNYLSVIYVIALFAACLCCEIKKRIDFHRHKEQYDNTIV